MWRQWCLITNLSHIHMVIMNVSSKLIPNSISPLVLKHSRRKCGIVACNLCFHKWKLNRMCTTEWGMWNLVLKITFGDLNSNLLPKGTLTRIYYPILLFLLLFGKKGKIIPKKKSKKNIKKSKKIKKIKKIKKNQRDLNSNLLPNTTFPIVENYAKKKIKKNQKNP